MKKCTRCGKEWPDTMAHCSDDFELLVPVVSQQTTGDEPHIKIDKMEAQSESSSPSATPKIIVQSHQNKKFWESPGISGGIGVTLVCLAGLFILAALGSQPGYVGPAEGFWENQGGSRTTDRGMYLTCAIPLLLVGMAFVFVRISILRSSEPNRSKGEGISDGETSQAKFDLCKDKVGIQPPMPEPTQLAPVSQDSNGRVEWKKIVPWVIAVPCIFGLASTAFSYYEDPVRFQIGGGDFVMGILLVVAVFIRLGAISRSESSADLSPKKDGQQFMDSEVKTPECKDSAAIELSVPSSLQVASASQKYTLTPSEKLEYKRMVAWLVAVISIFGLAYLLVIFIEGPVQFEIFIEMKDKDRILGKEYGFADLNSMMPMLVELKDMRVINHTFVTATTTYGLVCSTTWRSKETVINQLRKHPLCVGAGPVYYTK